MKLKSYLNLTNGLNYLSILKDKVDLSNADFVRIQSTACEQKLWHKILVELDYNFLVDIASGNQVFVFDTSACKNKSRALYQGLEWVKYFLNRYWFEKEYIPIVNGYNCTSYFNECYEGVIKIPEVKSKYKYLKKFIMTDNLKIYSISCNYPDMAIPSILLQRSNTDKKEQ